MPVDVDVLHAFGHGGEFGFAERIFARDHEDDVVGHQAEDGLEVALFARVHPGVDKGANCAFIVGHDFPIQSLRVAALRARTTALGTIACTTSNSFATIPLHSMPASSAEAPNLR